ncbi:MAG TPA: hypothetical protein VEI03_11055 [Stellaceae bacterium]|nr:hypothetical protein [Stellaceae bacterium]
MTDLPAPHDAIPESESRPGWRRFALALLPALIYVGLVLALFGGFTLDHLPQSSMARLGMVVSGALTLLLVALFLDRREAKRAAAEHAATAESGPA